MKMSIVVHTVNLRVGQGIERGCKPQSFSEFMCEYSDLRLTQTPLLNKNRYFFL